MSGKKYLEMDVLSAANERLNQVFNGFERVYVSFSAGKDSGVMLHLAIEAARRAGRLPLDVLFIDLEAQYAHTIDFAQRMMGNPDVTPHWVCLPLHLRNAVSQLQAHWLCWDETRESAWVRKMPDKCINDHRHFPFFRRGMEFEEFVMEFGEWFSQGKPTCCLVGIRSDESLNRYRTIVSQSKQTWQRMPWTTKVTENTHNAYPIYDWRTEDIWTANIRLDLDYNRIYDLMHMAGLSIHQMRICQPYGDDQRKGLWLFKALEPETWAKVVSRVEGANFGNRYSENDTHTLGNYRIDLPDGHTYESYAKFLLATMPPHLAAHYSAKIAKFLGYWKAHGFETIPDTADPKQEAARKAASWRRIAKVLLKNDYWCKGLSFSQTKRELERQTEMIIRYNEML